jgi:LPS export ABC transporter protein LptC
LTHPLFDNWRRWQVSPIMVLLMTVSFSSGGCRPGPKSPSSASPSPIPIEAKLELNNLSFEQVDKQGKPLWKVRAQKGVYAPDRKRARVTDLNGDFYQDGRVILHVTAKAGEVEQEGEKVLLRGDVIARETRNNLMLSGQEVEWQPKADVLTIRDKVRASHPQLQADADRGQYFSRQQRMELSGKISAVSINPRLAMQTEQLIWSIKDQIVTANKPIQIQRYEGQNITAKVQANSSTSKLDQKIINLAGNVQLNAVKPLIQVNGESFSWNLGRELVTADRPLMIVHQREQITFNANGGELNFPTQTATLIGNARGLATRNQAKLQADKLIWQMAAQQIIGTGNVMYQQTNPQVKFTGNRGVGKLQDQSIVVSSDNKQQVQTEIVPK